MKPSQIILLVHLGPVQDFIASARRCRDLWFGSQLLSDVARIATEALLGAAGGDREQLLIFPGELSHESSVANKIQLCLPAMSEGEVRRIAEAGRDAVRGRLQERAKERFERVAKSLELNQKSSDDLDIERALNQISEMMEYMWVAVDAGKSFSESGVYRETRSKAEALLAARKNTKNWKQTDRDDAGRPKSSLDGVRESVIDEEVYDTYSSDLLYKIFKVRPGERLCGVGLFKRLGTDSDNEVPIFHSTSHIANMPLLSRLSCHDEAMTLNHEFMDVVGMTANLYDSHEIRLRAKDTTYEVIDPRAPSVSHSAWRALRPERRIVDDRLGLDAVLLYPSRVEATGPSSLLNMVPKSKRKDLSKTLTSAQREVLKKLNVSEPFAYYAMLLADGDKMGEAIDALGDLDKHRKLSRGLDREFAQQCDALMQRHGATLIYAGGDDVLALVPLHTALRCARELRDLFAKAMRESIDANEFPLPALPTLSVGLAVAHHQEPLGEVRELAKRAERLAKDSGRNSLAIALAKRGNEPLLVSGTWDDEDDQPLDRRLIRWASLLENNEMPGRLPHRLLDVIAPLEAQLTEHTEGDLEALCERLVLQVLERRQLKDQELRDELIGLYDKALKTLDDHHDAFTSGRTLPRALRAVHLMSVELRIAEEFNRAWSMAFPSEDEFNR